jgi:hypothetical protein
VNGAVTVITELGAVVGYARHIDGTPLCSRKHKNIIKVLGSITPRLALEIR